MQTLEVFRKALKVASLIRESISNEMRALELGCSGRYIEPGPSGPLTRGRVDVLPTGRNFYMVDPRALPTEAAWRVGVSAVDKMLRHYVEKRGRYPEAVGVVLWSIDAYKAEGEALAQVLYLLGVEPVWDAGGRVIDLKPIPLERLGRPRIDCVVRISGIVRDTLRNYIELIDRAVEIVSSLPEPPEKNFVRKHVEEIARFIGDTDKARARVFSSPPGSYGTGVNYAVEASAWRCEDDLAKVWIQWSGYAYGRRFFGEPLHEVLVLSLKNVGVVVRDHVSDEHDPLNCCCYFAYHGGFYNAVKHVSGSEPEIVVIDSRDPSRPEVRDVGRELERFVRSKLLNRRWIEEVKKHGYAGASEVCRKILHLYGWAATTRKVNDWVFNEIARTYVLDPGMKEWFINNNPWALEEITRRLVEAAQRGIWKAPREILERVMEVHTEVEGVLEDDIVVGGDVQGGDIVVYTADEVDSWRRNLAKVEEVLKKFRLGVRHGKG